MLDTITNLDLLSVGIAVAGIGVLGFSIFFNNRRSATNRSFLYFSLLTIIWSITDYFAYKIKVPELSLSLFRIVIALGTWHSFFFFRLSYIFPKEMPDFPKWYKTILIPLVILTSILDLTPLVFSNIGEVSPDGSILKINNGPGIVLFGVLISFMIAGGIFILLKKTLETKGIERKQFLFTLIGILITFILIMIFNFILPAFFDNPRFIPLAGVFIFPYVAFVSYAIIRHRLLNLKIIAVEILTFALAVVMFFEILVAGEWSTVVFRMTIFALVLIFGILLIRSVRREVEQREELERLNVRLKEANIQLEDLNRFKTQLLSLASHQVKSPLAAIKGFVSLILDGTYGAVSDKIKEVLEKVKNSADELINLINTLLDLRKAEEGKMEYSFEKVNIVDLIKKIVDMLKPLSDSKKLELSFVCANQQIFVNADSQKLAQVIQNIVDNAIKYTPSGFVKIEISESNGDAIISVSDSGLGISAELLPHIFEEFTRDERLRKQIRGTGLGLYIAQKIVEAHNGRIWAVSEGEDKGSKFYVRLRKTYS